MPKSGSNGNLSAEQKAEKPFVNHAIKNSLRSGIDFLILFLLLRTVEAARHRLRLGEHPWSVCFGVVMLYSKLTSTLNPMRDELGLYRYLLMGKQSQRSLSQVDEPRETTNLFSDSPVLNGVKAPAAPPEIKISTAAQTDVAIKPAFLR
jgi:hypothetical protein